MNKTVTIESKNYKYQETYGGAIHVSDFNTYYEGTRNIADKIVSDWKFDEQCKRNEINLERKF